MPSDTGSTGPNHPCYQSLFNIHLFNAKVYQVLEFPGGYTRSVGPVIGRFLSELRDGRLVGVRTAGGRVLVPPSEHDPDTGEDVTDEFVEVGPVGTVTTWSWVAHPAKEHPLDRPFAWALIRPDGADTALLHALDVGLFEEGAQPPRFLKTGMRVRPKWRVERTGAIGDIECFRPEVTVINAPTRLEYELRGSSRASRRAGSSGTGARCASRSSSR